MTKYLVTGGAGFIGSHLADALVSGNNKVVAVDNLSTGSMENIYHLLQNNPRSFEFVKGDILDEELMKRLIKHCNKIYHLAAAVGVKTVVENPFESIKTNVRGTETVLDLASKYDKKVFVASTSEVYGKNGKMPFSENDDSVFGSSNIARWSYGCSKKLDEFYALACYHKSGLPVVIGRFFNTCGPRQTGRYGMVIPRFVEQALKGEPITVYDEGLQTRCFTYVGDVVDAMIKLMNTPESIGQIFNIGSSEPISILDLAKLIKELTNSSSQIVFVPYEQAYEKNFEDMKDRVPDLTKIQRTIGYSPKTTLDELLIKVIEEKKKVIY